MEFKKYWILFGICILTFVCYQRTLHNQFSNWDDDVYVSNDTVIKSLTTAHLKTIFTEDITKNNYHPLCMLSLAVNYQFAKLQPKTYYLTNILIHIANTVLVFFLLIELCKAPLNPPIRGTTETGRNNIPPLEGQREAGSLLIASLGALWFGIHPLHVESVAWIAERKDVLYTFFYLWGLLVYITPLTLPEGEKPKFNFIPLLGGRRGAVFLLFLCSCLSKPMAVVFPLSLLTIDFLTGRKIGWKLLTEKTIFFLAALGFGLFAVYTQNRTGAIADFSKLTIGERIMYASYGFNMYLYKLFNPNFLSTFYPYPYRYTDGTLPFKFYAAPFIALVILIVPLVLTYKRKPFYFKVLAFGLGFYLANVIFILQLISCGAAIMADRYSYVASIGIIFIVAFFINEFIKRYPSAKTITLTVVLILSAILSYACYQRTAVWHNAETLETDAIKKYPYQALLSYKWRGYYYLGQGDTNKAMQDFGALAEINAGDAKIYDELGNIYLNRNDYKNALALYNRSLQAENNVYITYADIAAAYASIGDTQNCTKNYVQALQLNREAEKRLAEISFNMVQAQKNKPAIIQYNTLILLNPNNPFYYFYRGVAEFSSNKMESSITDFKQAISFKNKDVSSVAAFNLAIACDSVNDEQNAILYANMAAKMGAPPKAGFMEKAERKMKGKK